MDCVEGAADGRGTIASERREGEDADRWMHTEPREPMPLLALAVRYVRLLAFCTVNCIADEHALWRPSRSGK